MGRIVITMVFLVVLAFSLTSVFVYKTTEAAGSPVEITFHEKFCRTVGWFVRPFGFCKYGLSQLDNKDFNTENVGNESVLVQTTDPNSLDSNKVLAVGGESISNNSSSATEVPIGNIEYITNEYIVSDNTSIVENLLAQRIGEVLHYIDTLHPIATLPKSYSDSDYVTNDLLLKSLDKVYDSIQDIDSDTVVTSNYWSESAGNVYRSTGKVGIGTTLPTSALSVNGDIYVSGAFKDSSNSVGTSGMVLQTTATGTKWVATSSLGIIGGATSSVTVLNDLTNVNANSVAGSLLYFNGVEWTDIATSSLGILAGTSTNFWTQSGADIYYNIGNVGIGRTSPNAMLSIAKPATGNLAYFGDEIAFSAVGNRTQIVVGDGDNDTTFIIGQDSTHGLNFWWDYNATAASARGVLETWGGSNPLVLQSSGGNVGIGGGELSPDFKLEVIGDFGISSTANTDGDLFVVTSSGDIGIGTTSPTSLLDVWGDFKVGTSTTPLVYANPAIKRVGLGTVSPATLLHLSDVSPYIRIDDTTDTGTWFELAETSNGGLLATRALTGASLLSIDARAVDGASDATIRLFRNTNTTGVKLFQLAKGDNSSTIHAQIGVDGQDSFFQIGGGNVGIGTTTPASKLTVAGTIQTTSGIRFADGTFQTTATGGGSGGTMVTNWPDRIRCSSTSYGERVIDLANAPYVADGYYYYSKGADWVSFDSNGDYVSNSGTWGSLTSCTVDITTLYTQGRAYNTVGGGSNLWTATSSDIFFGGGNVGIGTTTPDSLLVAGDDNMRLRFNNSVDELDDPFNIGVSTVAGYSARRFTLESLVGATQVGLQFSDGLANDTIFGIGRSADTGATWNSLLSIQADGDIGFGTSTPNTDFEFYNANGADTRLRLSNDNGVNSRWEIATGDSFGDGNDFAIWGGSEGAEDYRFTINSLGNIGIGTTTPSSKLDVWGGLRVGTGSTPTLFVDPATNRVGIGTNAPGAALAVAGSMTISGNFYTSKFIDSDNGAYLVNPSTTGVSAALAGSVGIGTTTPQDLLSIYGGSAAYGSINIGNNFGGGYNGIWLNGATTTSSYNFLSSASDYDLYINRPSGYNIHFREDNDSNSQLFIEAGGNVGIGTTTPGAELTVANTIQFASLGSAGAGLVTDADGNVTVSSDERLKDIESGFETGLSELLLIDPILYHWNKESGLETEGIYAGFSAQNVMAAIPEAVGEDKRGFLTLADRPILAAVVNAIKELYAMVTGNQEKIDELEERIKTLEQNSSSAKNSGSKNTTESADSSAGSNPETTGDDIDTTTDQDVASSTETENSVTEEAGNTTEIEVDEEAEDSEETKVEIQEEIVTNEDVSENDDQSEGEAEENLL